MKKIPVILLLALFAMPSIFAQVKIGDNPQAISPTSVLELESNDRVLVITRINTAQMDAIVPNQGAMVYNTDSQCIHYYDGTQWVNLCNSAGLVFTTDPIVNDVSTVVITDQAGTKNFEVAPNSIGSLQIINGGINGVDIQDGSIGPGKLQNQSVTQDKLSENSVGAFALDNANINLSDFTNDQGFITIADVISTAAGNDIIDNGGAFYDDQALQDDITANTTFINAHITADADTNANNEIQTLSFNAGANQLTLTNPSGDNIITLPGGGNPTDELITNAQLTGTDLIITDPGQTWTIPLGGLTGGNPSLTDVLTQGNDAGAAQIRNVADPTLPQDAATRAYVDANIGGNQNLAQVLAQGTDGGAALIKNILDPVDPQDAATRAFVLATVASGGALTDGSILIGGAGDVAQQLAVMGDATLANDGTLTIANDAVNNAKIIDGAVTNNKILPGAADQILRTASDGLSVAWVDLPTGAAVISDATLTGDGTSAATALGIAPAAALTPVADQMLITNDAGVIEWAQISGTENSVFYAGPNGLPTTVDENANLNDDRGFFWDPDGRDLGGANKFGALYIGLESTNAQSQAAKVHIADNFPGLTYSLHLQNFNSNANRTTGILFSTVDEAYGKGSLIFDSQGGNGIGDFHFLQNNTTDTSLPAITDKAFTIKNNKDIILYGGIDINTVGTGAANEVLTADGTGGITWAAAGGGGTDNQQLTLEPGNLLTLEDGGTAINLTPFLDDQTAAEVTVAATPTNYTVATADVEAHLAGINTALASGGHNGTAAGSIFFSGDATPFAPTEDNTQLFWDNTNDKLYVGPQNTTTADVKLNVGGTTRTQGIKNSNGSAGTPSYRFTEDLDSGMYLIDNLGILGFSTNNSEAIRIDPSQNVGISEIDPTSKLHTGGSFATAVQLASGVTALDETDHTIVFNGNGSISLPTPGSCPGRIYIIKNPSFTVGSDSYSGTFGANQTTIPAGVVWLQSTGSSWEQVN